MNTEKRTIGGHKIIQGGLSHFILCNWIVDRDAITKNRYLGTSVFKNVLPT